MRRDGFDFTVGEVSLAFEKHGENRIEMDSKLI